MRVEEDQHLGYALSVGVITRPVFHDHQLNRRCSTYRDTLNHDLTQVPRTDLEEFSVHVGSVCQNLMLCEAEAEMIQATVPFLHALALEEEDDAELMSIFHNRLLTNYPAPAFNVRCSSMMHLT
jgi:hypothetical protein